MSHFEDRELTEWLDTLGANERASAEDQLESMVAEDAGALAALTARLDVLAQTERETAPTGLDQRVLDAVGETFAPAPIRIMRARWLVTAGGMAAAIAVIGGVWMTQRAGSSPAGSYDYERVTFEQDVDLLLDLYETDVWGDSLADVEREAERVEEGLDLPWAAYDDVAGSMESGAAS